jgi:FhuF 2Fe-2S C-terminal domain
VTRLKPIAEQVDINGLRPVPASAITDPGWLAGQLSAAARRYRFGRRAALGVLWWYSASSVLLGPPVEGRDPGLDSVTLYLHEDGRILDASSDTLPGNDIGALGRRLAEALSTSIEAVAACTGAPDRALWAIATDSLANRVLWAGRAPAFAERLAAAVGPELPMPRYVEVSGRLVVRRASCCLIYEAPGQEKCVSCPRQTPETRIRRLSHRL